MLALAPASAFAETCTADSFGDAVDASAAELRAFSAETQPRLKESSLPYETTGAGPTPISRPRDRSWSMTRSSTAFDAEAGELLSKIDTLGSPEAATGRRTPPTAQT